MVSAAKSEFTTLKDPNLSRAIQKAKGMDENTKSIIQMDSVRTLNECERFSGQDG